MEDFKFFLKALKTSWTVYRKNFIYIIFLTILTELIIGIQAIYIIGERGSSVFFIWKYILGFISLFMLTYILLVNCIITENAYSNLNNKCSMGMKEILYIAYKKFRKELNLIIIHIWAGAFRIPNIAFFLYIFYILPIIVWKGKDERKGKNYSIEIIKYNKMFIFFIIALMVLIELILLIPPIIFKSINDIDVLKLVGLISVIIASIIRLFNGVLNEILFLEIKKRREHFK